MFKDFAFWYFLLVGVLENGKIYKNHHSILYNYQFYTNIIFCTLVKVFLQIHIWAGYLAKYLPKHLQNFLNTFAAKYLGWYSLMLNLASNNMPRDNKNAFTSIKFCKIFITISNICLDCVIDWNLSPSQATKYWLFAKWSIFGTLLQLEYLVNNKPHDKYLQSKYYSLWIYYWGDLYQCLMACLMVPM